MSAPISGLPATAAPNPGDLIAISQNGAEFAIPYADLIDGATIGLLLAAGPASDTDTLLTGQGSNILQRQTLGALWAWMAGHLPGY